MTEAPVMIEAAGGRAIAVQADVAAEDQVARLFETVDRELGPVTAPVKNAGIAGTVARLDAVPGEIVRLAREVAQEGIRVNGVARGVVETEIHAALGLPDRIAQMAPSLPIGRAGAPEEIAEAILWLLSESASYTTGTPLRVAGGQ